MHNPPKQEQIRNCQHANHKIQSLLLFHDFLAQFSHLQLCLGGGILHTIHMTRGMLLLRPLRRESFEDVIGRVGGLIVGGSGVLESVVLLFGYGASCLVGRVVIAIVGIGSATHHVVHGL